MVLCIKNSRFVTPAFQSMTMLKFIKFILVSALRYCFFIQSCKDLVILAIIQYSFQNSYLSVMPTLVLSKPHQCLIFRLSRRVGHFCFYFLFRHNCLFDFSNVRMDMRAGLTTPSAVPAILKLPGLFLLAFLAESNDRNLNLPLLHWAQTLLAFQISELHLDLHKS